jgi:hypothetical protein
MGLKSREIGPVEHTGLQRKSLLATHYTKLSLNGGMVGLSKLSKKQDDLLRIKDRKKKARRRTRGPYRKSSQILSNSQKAKK